MAERNSCKNVVICAIKINLVSPQIWVAVLLPKFVTEIATTCNEL